LVQFGDLHLDSVFESSSPEKAAARRKASRQLLYDTVKYASDVNADIILCTGDLFDTNAPYYETLRSAADAFSRVKIPVFISPGNHDPYRKDSPYSSSWSENVHVFKEPHPREIVLEKLGVRITGIVNTEQNQASRPLIDYTVKKDGLINILITHGDCVSGESKYLNIPPEDILKSGFDYIALGHIHIHSVKKIGNTTLVQNGSMEGRGYDEPGEKGLVYAEISGTGVEVKLVPLGGTRCAHVTVDISGLSTDEIIKNIRTHCPHTPSRTILKVELTGLGSIGRDELYSALSDFESVKLVDNTFTFGIDEDSVDKNSMKGLFIKNIREMCAADAQKKEIYEKALIFGIAALENREQPRI
jgi:DNA repair exonuclease SbcCD nuclease subunit